MNINNIKISEFSSKYNGEIFVKVSTSNEFNSIKYLVDEYKLICFIEDKQVIYTQGVEYGGFTPQMVEELNKISLIDKSISEIYDKINVSDDNKSIIGSLSYTITENGISKNVNAENVTQFVKALITAIQTGNADLGNELANLDKEVNFVKVLLKDFDTNDENLNNVKQYIDNHLTLLVTDLEDKINNIGTTIEGDDVHILIENLSKKITDAEGNEIYLQPFKYKIKGNDIASESAFNSLKSKIDSILGNKTDSIEDIINHELTKALVPEDAKESLDTLKEIADWIQSHPDEAASLNSSIKDLQNKWDDNIDTLVRLGNIYDGDGKLKTIKGGVNYAQTLEEVNDILKSISFAKDVQDGAEQNWLTGINVPDQSIKINNEDVIFNLNGGNNTSESKLVKAKYDESTRTIELSLNKESIESIGNTIYSESLKDSKQYVDSKLSWKIK